MKHTQGPWKVVTYRYKKRTLNYQRPGVLAADHWIVTEITPGKNTDADARLIAAAPDLLEACKAALFWLNLYGEHMPIQYLSLIHI